MIKTALGEGINLLAGARSAAEAKALVIPRIFRALGINGGQDSGPPDPRQPRPEPLYNAEDTNARACGGLTSSPAPTATSSFESFCTMPNGSE